MIITKSIAARYALGWWLFGCVAILLGACTSLQPQRRYNMLVEFIGTPNELQGYTLRQLRLHGIISVPASEANYRLRITGFAREDILLGSVGGGSSDYSYEARLVIDQLSALKNGAETNLISAPIVIRISKAVTLHPSNSYLANETTNRGKKREVYTALADKSAQITLRIINSRNTQTPPAVTSESATKLSQ